MTWQVLSNYIYDKNELFVCKTFIRYWNIKKEKKMTNTQKQVAINKLYTSFSIWEYAKAMSKLYPYKFIIIWRT